MRRRVRVGSLIGASVLLLAGIAAAVVHDDDGGRGVAVATRGGPDQAPTTTTIDLGTSIVPTTEPDGVAPPTSSAKPRSSSQKLTARTTIPGPVPTSTGPEGTRPTIPTTTLPGGGGTNPQPVCTARTTRTWAGPATPVSAREEGLYVMRSDGSGLKKVFASPTGRTFYWTRWSPTEDAILASDDKVLAVVPTDGRPPVTIADASMGLHNMLGLDWSPDGSQVAFVARPGDPYATARLYVSAKDGSGRREVWAPSEHAGTPRWAPDGRRFLAMSGTTSLWMVAADGSSARQLTGIEVPFEYEWSPRGDRIVLRGTVNGTSGLHLLDGEGRLIRTLETLAGHGLSWSPDCRSVASGADRTLRVYDVDSGSSRTLWDGRQQERTTEPYHVFWTPDGTTIVGTSFTHRYEDTELRTSERDVTFTPVAGGPPRVVVDDPWPEGRYASAHGVSQTGEWVTFNVHAY